MGKLAMNKGKIRIACSLGIALFGVCVAAVSTAAWFQITGAGKNVSDDVTVQTGSSNLTIDSVNAYKSAYDQIDAETTDYTSSHVIGYNLRGTASDTNINQGAVTGFDVPAEGVGYYIVGDELWTSYAMGMDEENIWKYSASRRFSDAALSDNNIGIVKHVYLTEGADFKVRHHYFDGGNMRDVWVNAAIDTSDATTNASFEIVDGNIRVRTGQSAYYDLYLESDNAKIKAASKTVPPGPEPNLNSRGYANGPKIKKVGSGSHPVTRIYLNDNWQNVNYNSFHLWGFTFETGYSTAELETVFIDQYGERKETALSNNADSGWSYNGSSSGDYRITPIQKTSESTSPSVDLPEWVTGFHFQAMNLSWANSNWIPNDGYEMNSNNGYKQTIELKTTGKSGDTVSFEQYVYGTPSKNWGSATIYRKASYTNQGSATRYTEDIDSVSVSKFYIYEDPSDPSLSGYVWQEEGWYTDSALDTPLGTKFVTEDTLTIYTAFRRCTYFNLYVYKRKHDGTEEVMSDYNGASWSAYTDAHSEPSFTPPETGYGSWSGTWYKTRSSDPISYSNAYGSSDIGSTDLENPTNLYTYIVESSALMTVTKKYLSVDHNSVTKTGGYKDSITYYCDTSFTMATLDTLDATDNKKLNVPDDDEYDFLGYSTTATGDSNIIDEDTKIFTSATTNLYALFVPKGPHWLHKYKAFEIYDGSAYTDLFECDNTAFAAYETSEIASSETLYDTIELGVPSTSSVEYVYVDRSIYTAENGLVSGVYKFVSDGWYVGDDSGCDFLTPYEAANPRADVYLYERMLCTLADHTTLYVDTEGPRWNDAKAYFFFSGVHTIALSQNTFNDSGSFLSELRIPTNDNSLRFLVFSGADASPVSIRQTPNIVMDASQWASKGANNTLEVYNTRTGDNYNWGWGIFYGRPTPDTTGYYLVGNAAFVGTDSGSWTLSTGTLMSAPASVPEDISDSVVAYKENVTFAEGMEFKILSYNSSSGKQGEWIGNNLNDDAETQTYAINNSGGSIRIKTGITGTKFSVYLTAGHKVVIRDTESSAYIVFNNAPIMHSDKLFRMGYGDHTTAVSPANLALFEQGIQITQKDIDDHLSFVIRDRLNGSLNWHTYLPDGNHGFSGDAELIAQGAVADSTTYGDSTLFTTGQYAAAGTYGYTFTRPGYYKFYLTSAGLVSIAPMPGDYGEGYYVVPVDSNISGTDYYTKGLKLKEIHNGTNLAVYTCYSVSSANLSVFFRCYRNGVDTHHTVGGNDVFCSVMASNEYATMSNGILTFNNPGAYNLYIYEESSTIKVSVTEFTKDNFFTLNSINKNLGSQDEIKDARTAIALEVGFTTTNPNYNVQAIAQMICSGSGSSDYLDFRYAVITNDTDDDYNSYDNCYDYMYDKHYIGGTNYSPTNLSSGQHRMIILIDYKYSALSSLPISATTNNFYFVIKMEQTTS